MQMTNIKGETPTNFAMYRKKTVSLEEEKQLVVLGS